MRTVVVTGSASGLGAATTKMLREAGQRVIGVDLAGAEVEADLGTAEGRAHALAEIRTQADGALEGLVTFAGLGPLTGRPGSSLVSVNYFGTIELVAGLRDLLAAGDQAAAVTISSKSTTTHQGGVPQELVDACLAHDEPLARKFGDEVGSVKSYTGTKTAIARWTRRHAPTPEWAGAGITLNVVAPGHIETPLTAAMAADPAFGGMLKNETMTPLGRQGLPEDIAPFVLFLLGPGGRFFCGSFLCQDGGVDALLRPDAWPQGWDPTSDSASAR